MKKKLKTPVLAVIATFLALLFLLPMLVHRQGKVLSTTIETHQSEEHYLANLAPRVKQLASFYGIKPSILLGQIGIASEYGHRELAHDYHNLLNLEAKEEQFFIEMVVLEMADGDSKQVTKRFARYYAWDDSVMDYLERLRTGDSWGKEIYETMATTKDYKKVAKVIQKHQFPQESDYADKLVKVIERYDLTRYDK